MREIDELELGISSPSFRGISIAWMAVKYIAAKECTYISIHCHTPLPSDFAICIFFIFLDAENFWGIWCKIEMALRRKMEETKLLIHRVELIVKWEIHSSKKEVHLGSTLCAYFSFWNRHLGAMLHVFAMHIHTLANNSRYTLNERFATVTNYYSWVYAHTRAHASLIQRECVWIRAQHFGVSINCYGSDCECVPDTLYAHDAIRFCISASTSTRSGSFSADCFFFFS